KRDGLDPLARLERMVCGAVGAVADEIRQRQSAAPVCCDRRIISEQRHGHGRRMRGHARPEIEGGVIEMIARSRRTLGAALLETADLRIAEIPAARTLSEVAAERCQMPDLRRSEALRGCGDAGIGTRDALI